VGNYLLEKNGNFVRIKTRRDIWIGLLEPRSEIFCSKLGITSSNLWRKSAVVDVGGWDESLTSAQEYDLMFRIFMKNEKAVYDNHFLTIVHKTENSISTSFQKIEENALTRITLRYKIKKYLATSGKF